MYMFRALYMPREMYMLRALLRFVLVRYQRMVPVYFRFTYLAMGKWYMYKSRPNIIKYIIEYTQ